MQRNTRPVPYESKPATSLPE